MTRMISFCLNYANANAEAIKRNFGNKENKLVSSDGKKRPHTLGIMNEHFVPLSAAGIVNSKNILTPVSFKFQPNLCLTQSLNHHSCGQSTNSATVRVLFCFNEFSNAYFFKAKDGLQLCHFYHN